MEGARKCLAVVNVGYRRREGMGEAGRTNINGIDSMEKIVGDWARLKLACVGSLDYHFITCLRCAQRIELGCVVPEHRSPGART